jgi:hypothetical protein
VDHGFNNNDDDVRENKRFQSYQNFIMGPKMADLHFLWQEEPYSGNEVIVRLVAINFLPASTDKLLYS